MTPREATRKIAVAMLFSAMALALTSAQEKSPANESAAPSIGLEIGKEAPAFLARDQFDHEQTNETLKGPRGTVLLFFRSADW